jgi:hypothetical protein
MSTLSQSAHASQRTNAGGPEKQSPGRFPETGARELPNRVREEQLAQTVHCGVRCSRYPRVSRIASDQRRVFVTVQFGLIVVSLFLIVVSVGVHLLG